MIAIILINSNFIGVCNCNFKELVCVYRMPPHLMMDLLELVYNDLAGQRSTRLPPHIQLLVCVRFLASGGYQKDIAQNMEHPISQTSVSRCIDQVLEALSNLRDTFIRFPVTAAQRQRISARFKIKSLIKLNYNHTTVVLRQKYL